MAVLTPMQKARSQLLLQHPFWASIVMSTEMIADKTIPTACTNMVNIRYNPDFIDKLEPAVVIFVLVHEAMHIMFKHGLRRDRRDAQLWNIACDHAINLKLQEWRFKLWEFCCADPRYIHMSAEEIYDLLEKEGGGGGGEDGEQGGFGGDLEEPAEGKEATDQIERAINRKIVQATMVARMAGNLPADLDRMLGDLIEAKVPWFELLREFLSFIVHDEETWAKRNRRFSKIYLPSKYNEVMGEIVVIVDTSGSIGQKELTQVASETNAIAYQCKPERIRVVYCDAGVAGEEVFEQGEELVLHPKGGGGTDMRVALKHVEQFDPIVVILLTDGYSPWPTTEPDFPLLVVCTTDHPIPIPIGTVVRIKG